MTAPQAVLDQPQCERDHALWLEDIETWKREHSRALEMLEETADFIRRHDSELAEHLEEIREHEKAVSEGRPPSEETKAKHLAVRERHNIFAGRHRGLMAEVVKLRVALHKAAHGNIVG